MSAPVSRFRAKVYAHYETFGRKTLPWRHDLRPWAVLVSEVMLQQTQVERVAPYWRRWLEMWPDPAALGRAPLAGALAAWSGLGYNRRGRALWECAGRMSGEYGGEVPKDRAALESLPGIGRYTAGAVRCFAFNEPELFIETNIRAALLDYFFPNKEGVRDAELLPALEKSLDGENPRRWYWALMDWGAALKKLRPNPNRRGARYARQSAFEGSFRQRRGAILRLLLEGPAAPDALGARAGLARDEVCRVAVSLEKDRLIVYQNGAYMIR